MMQRQAIEFMDRINGSDAHFICVTVSIPKVLESWKDSVFSFQWLKPDGSIKTITELSEDERPKREAVEDDLRKGKPIAKPIMGIGVYDNVEIGAGREVLLTLASHGVEAIPVHIPKSNESDFKHFIADVSS